MDKTKLNKEELAQVKSWIAKKGYSYLDVQYEILDHVATAIEQKRAVNPELNLEKAFTEVHRSFGIFGFSEMEQSFSSALERRFWRLFGKSLYTQFLQLRYLQIHLALVAIFLLSKNMISNYTYALPIVFIIILIGFLLVQSLRTQKKMPQLKKLLTFTYVNRIYIFLGILPSFANFFYRASQTLVDWNTYSDYLVIGFLLITSMLVIANQKVSKVFLQESERMHALYGKLA